MAELVRDGLRGGVDGVDVEPHVFVHVAVVVALGRVTAVRVLVLARVRAALEEVERVDRELVAVAGADDVVDEVVVPAAVVHDKGGVGELGGVGGARLERVRVGRRFGDDRGDVHLVAGDGLRDAAHTFVDATTVSVPSPVVSEPHAVRVRAAANDSPTAAVAARKPEEARTENS